jgi:hypothetical protein
MAIARVTVLIDLLSSNEMIRFSMSSTNDLALWIPFSVKKYALRRLEAPRM